jgi:hypothetical protein
MYRPKRDAVTGEWKRLHNKKLHRLYSTKNIIRVIKIKTRWAGHVARMEYRRGAYRVSVRKLDGRIILK